MFSVSKKHKNIFILSALLTVIISLAVFKLSEKYSPNLLSKNPNHGDEYYYSDLDSDGNTERIEVHKSALNQVNLLVYNKSKVINQWNFNGICGNIGQPMIIDIDNDGTKEVILFSVLHDTLYMHCVDAINDKVKFAYRKICKVFKVNGQYDYAIQPIYKEFKQGKDENIEIVFCITSGFPMQPRQMFAYYPACDSLYASPKSCAAIYFPFAFDIDNDNHMDFFVSCGANGNCKSSIAYSDQFCWIMGFDRHMKFKFPPQRIDKYSAYTTIKPVVFNKKKYLLCKHAYFGTESTPCFMALVNAKGEIVKRRNMECNEQVSNADIFSNDSFSCFLVKRNGEVASIDSNLNFKTIATYPGSYFYSTIQKIALIDNEEKELLMFDRSSHTIYLTDQNFKYLSLFKIPEAFLLYTATTIRRKNQPTKIAFNTENYTYIFSFEKSIIYRYWYAVIIAIYAALLLTLYLYKYIIETRIIRKENTKNKIAKLQIQSFQNQIDPHFTFNLLESFGSLIHEQDTDKAAYIFNNYARLLKSTIINSDRVFITLKEELDFVKCYLDLEAFRYSNKFSYQIRLCENGCGQIIIPKMMVQIFVENSIKHGLKHLHSNGLLEISSHKNGATFTIQITDNGIGRKKAREYNSFSTGKGLESINQILALYYDLHKTKISYRITDLEDNDSQPAGTQVEINIPIKNKLWA